MEPSSSPPRNSAALHFEIIAIILSDVTLGAFGTLLLFDSQTVSGTVEGVRDIKVRIAGGNRRSAGVSPAVAWASWPREVALAVRERDAPVRAGGTPALRVSVPFLRPASPPANSHFSVVHRCEAQLALLGDSVPSRGREHRSLLAAAVFLPDFWHTIITLLASLLFAVSPALAAGTSWGVVSSAPLDPRIQTQLEELAAQNQAELHSFPSVDQARSAGSALSIELVAASSAEAFIVELQKLAGAPDQALTPALASEGYIFSASYEGPSPPSKIRIEAESPKGFHYGLLRIPQLLGARPPNIASELEPPAKFQSITAAGRNSLVIVGDFPSFPERGIVEGFYGTPWSSQDRLDLLRFEGQRGMNVYYYAPKDDPYHRKLWREPYPPEQMSALKGVVDAAHANFVDFCFAISPGLSMTYSDDEEFAKLTTKLESVGKLGVSCFALFLDDVPPELQDPQDQARFQSVAAAHVYVVNKLYRYLLSQSPENRLTVAPTTYTNDWGSRDYIREMGAGVDPHVKLVWTGTKVVPPQITAAQAREWGKLLQRNPLLWDNFPVNDGIPWRLNLGPLRGRDPDLASTVSGFVSNPMNQAHASMIPLQTVADYLWNARAYSPETALKRAIVDQYGPGATRLLQPFLKVYGDYWWDDNLFKPLFVETRKPFDVARMEPEIALLQSALQPLENQERFGKLLPELAPFPSKTRTRLNAVAADEAFRRQPDGRLMWRDDYDVLHASVLGDPVRLEADAASSPGGVYQLASSSQLAQGADLWKGPEQFSARVALGWDPQYLYISG